MKAVNPDCLFVMTSTDLVYDGEDAPYEVNEDKMPFPNTGKIGFMANMEI